MTKLPNSEQSNKGKVKTHKYINRQNQSTIVGSLVCMLYFGFYYMCLNLFDFRGNDLIIFGGIHGGHLISFLCYILCVLALCLGSNIACFSRLCILGWPVSSTI
jgi:hypothetical protein